MIRDEVFALLFSDMVSRIGGPFVGLPPAMQVDVVNRINAAVDGLMPILGGSEGGGQGGGGPQGPQPASVAYASFGEVTAAATSRVDLGILLRIEDMPNHDGAQGKIRVFQNGCELINFGTVAFPISAENLTEMFPIGAALVTSEAVPTEEQIPMVAVSRVRLVPVTEYVSAPGTVATLVHCPAV